MKLKKVKLAELHIDPANPRIGNVEAIKASLSEFGQDQNLVVRESTMTIIKGNHRYKAMEELGWNDCYAMLVDDTEIGAVRRGLSDNRTSDIAFYDTDALAKLVREAGGDDIPAFDFDYVDALLRSHADEVSFTGEGADDEAMGDEDYGAPDSSIRQIQLFIENEAYDELVGAIAELRTLYETDNITDTVIKAIFYAYNKIGTEEPSE